MTQFSMAWPSRWFLAFWCPPYSRWWSFPRFTSWPTKAAFTTSNRKETPH